jgi:diaminohydroxyphosphoribosylaminopyrimidine deaminase/5-amino-6-(5-phosphoribosylamino)uracil reductase
MTTDEHFMKIAIDLAKNGLGSVSPNPMVGCVIVKNNEIIGQGYHQKYGEAHAEPNAVKSVGDNQKIKNSDIYVSLEPCSHFGKTPPCADLLVSLKPKRVIIANLDTNPLVSGKGIEKLQTAGIEVVVGVLEKEARELNKRFFTNFEKKRPYIILKWAQTADGFIAGENYEQIQISCPEAMQFSHQLRATEDAILVGTNTAFYDNPKLNTRLVEGKNPIRIFIDKNLKIPKAHHLLDQSTPTICYNSIKNDEIENLIFEKVESDYIEHILHSLQQKKIGSLIIEGGSSLLQSFIDKGLWDETFVIESKKIIENGIKSPIITDYQLFKTNILGIDELKIYKN